MPDVFSPDKRSEVMSKIRNKGNKDTELVLISIFQEYHIVGWRRHQKLLGKPDFTFWKQRLVVFVDGCFWHACPQHMNIPEHNQEFWINKMTANKQRDVFVNKELVNKNWKVIRIWEHDLKNRENVARQIINALSQS